VQSTSLTIIATPYGKNHDKVFMRGFCITFENSSCRYVNSPISRYRLNVCGEINIPPLAASLIPNAGFAGIQNYRFNIQDRGKAPVASSKIIGGLPQNTIS
jgi:hypothetical protein